jgi:hypothetical protein
MRRMPRRPSRVLCARRASFALWPSEPFTGQVVAGRLVVAALGDRHEVAHGVDGAVAEQTRQCRVGSPSPSLEETATGAPPTTC